MKSDVILCPVDNSRNSSVAFDLISRIARPGNKVILLHVVGAGDEPLSLKDSWMHHAELKLRDSILDGRNVEVEHLTLSGAPVEVITSVAKRKHADLIVMGTHGRTGLSRLMMGSVAQGVLAAAPCTVVTVRPVQLQED